MNAGAVLEAYKLTKETERIAQDLTRCLCLRTKPIAVTMMTEESHFPEGALRPLRDLGKRLSLCQAFSYARRRGTSIVMRKEDNWCFEPVVGLGLSHPPEGFLEGKNRYPATAKTLQAGSRWARNMPRFPAGRYTGISVSPLERADKDPDLIITYCDPTQLTLILVAVNWIDGHDVTSTLSGHAGCVYATVPAMENRNYSVTVPCMGDRARGLAAENELVFSIPWEKAGDLVEALLSMEQRGGLFPIDYGMQLEYPLAKSYVTLGHQVGLRSEKGEVPTESKK